MSKKAEQEWNVGLRIREQCREEGNEYMKGTNLDTPDAELHQGPKHFPPSNFIRRAADGNLDEKTVVVGLTPETSIGTELNGSVGPTVICAPAKPELASNRTPFPPALR